MLDHHLQRSIVYRLAFSHQLRFSELKPDIVDSKLFTYHLKKVVSAGYVEKTSDGLYRLTSEGRRLGIQVLQQQHAELDRAYSVLLLIIRRKSDGAWLLYQRQTHPLLDRVGFVHCVPNAEETVVQTASKHCFEKTGLKAHFTVQGNGYFRMYDNQEIESFINFTLLAAEDADGELVQNDDHGHFFWEPTPDFTDTKMLPNIPRLATAYQKGDLFFLEETLHV